ncbi:MAG: hypothetical protein ACOYOF_21060 [Verrucomicrobiaceae bacterium]
MDTVANIISDWMIALIAFVEAAALAWITYSTQQRSEMVAMITTAKTALRRFLTIATAFSAPALFVVSLIAAPWPPSRFGLSLIVVSGLLTLWRLLLPMILRSWKFSIDAHDDFMEWHRIHFALLEELITGSALTDDEVMRIRQRMAEITKTYQAKRQPKPEQIGCR